MALKDWKKIGKTKWRKNNVEIVVELAFLSDEYTVDIYRWTAYQSNIQDIDRRGFKTKAQALKFAKSYMRKN